MKHNKYYHARQNQPTGTTGISPKAGQENGIIGKVGGSNNSYRIRTGHAQVEFRWNKREGTGSIGALSFIANE